MYAYVGFVCLNKINTAIYIDTLIAASNLWPLIGGLDRNGLGANGNDIFCAEEKQF